MGSYYCYVAACSAALGASAPTEGGERGAGAYHGGPRLQLVISSFRYAEAGLVEIESHGHRTRTENTFGHYYRSKTIIHRQTRTGGVLGAVPSAAV